MQSTSASVPVLVLIPAAGSTSNSQGCAGFNSGLLELNSQGCAGFNSGLLELNLNSQGCAGFNSGLLEFTLIPKAVLVN